MVERRSKPKQSKVCEVVGCKKDAERSVPVSKLKGAVGNKLPLKVEKGEGRVHLCKDHYKVYKKATKKERKLDSLAWR